MASAASPKLLKKADNIHRFPAKMTPGLAYGFLRRIQREYRQFGGNDSLRFHDPMCGSGTTALMARFLKFQVSATDLSYPAVITTRAKLTRLSEVGIERIKTFVDTLEIPEGSPRMDSWKEWRIWFTSSVLSSLERIRDAILAVRRLHTFPHLLTAFFQTVWDVSAADKRVIVPTRSKYSTEAPSLSTSEVLDRFASRIRRILNAQQALRAIGISKARPPVSRGDSCNAPSWPSDLVDVILTSPPYGCGIDYERAFRLQMNLIRSFVPNEDSRRLMIGRRSYLSVQGDEIARLGIRDLDGLRSIQSRTPSRFRMFAQYLTDLHAILSQSHRHLSRHGTLALVIGNPEIGRRRIPLSNLAVDMAEEVGFELKANPVEDRIRNRIQNFHPRSANDPIQSEFLLWFSRV